MKPRITRIARMIFGLLLITGAAYAQRLRIDFVVLNDAATATQAVDRVLLTKADTARLQGAIDARGGSGGALARLKSIIIGELKLFVRHHEMQALRQQYSDQLSEAENALNNIGE
jgi:hypothetical protein